MNESKPVSYASYLKVEELLALQHPLSDGPEHDELLFIVIHQSYELWFKQCLHELNALRVSLFAGDTLKALFLLKRVLTIFKSLVAQVDILETMTPLRFNAFRERLEASSGFQSVQFRELEFLLGHRRRSVLQAYAEGSLARARLHGALQAPSLYTAFLNYLSGQGYAMPEDALRACEETTQADVRVQDSLVAVYRAGDFCAEICERLVDLDEGLQEWRYRHVKMVERTIGSKMGTGGSAGVEYLQRTLFTPLFPDLWAIRSRL